MTPEEEARQEIDRLLEAAVWQVQDFRDYKSNFPVRVILISFIFPF